MVTLTTLHLSRLFAVEPGRKSEDEAKNAAYRLVSNAQVSGAHASGGRRRHQGEVKLILLVYHPGFSSLLAPLPGSFKVSSVNFQDIRQEQTKRT